MSRNVRIVLLALALGLCTLANMAPPASALALKYCGAARSCELQSDCTNYCLPCGYQNMGCAFQSHGSIGSCACL